MKISIIAVGKLKEDYLREAQKEYLKRLGRYCQIHILEVPDEKIPDKCSMSNQHMIRAKEGEKIERQLSGDSFRILLDVRGEKLSSEEFAKKISGLEVSSKKHLQFIIGGSLGISEKLKSQVHMMLSMSDMTFPHQIARILLLEQIYRSYKILRGETYHK